MKKNIFQNNRAAWNEALEYHQKARKNSLQTGFRNPEFTTFDRDCDHIVIEKLNEIDLRGKTISQIPCNNGRELLSLMKWGAKEAVGFDISDTAISEARQLAQIAQLNATFVRTNVLEIDDAYHGYFDFIYISEGSLQWFPDLHDYFSVISKLLKPNGHVFIVEIHPFAYLFENGFDAEKQNLGQIISYFEKGPYSYKDGLDYIGGVQYQGRECFWYMHTMSDILNAIRQNGIEMTELNEYNLEMANNPQPGMENKFPLSYIFIGKKRF